MARVYADAAYYIGLLLSNDDLHGTAIDVATQYSSADLVTSDPVLVEVLAHVSGLGPVARKAAVDLVRELQHDDSMTLVPQTRELFDAGLNLYEQRIDKGYSLTDCMSMIVCRQQQITDVLTHDHHFMQEGFTILL